MVIFRVELEEKVVVNDPPNRRFELPELGVMTDTGPLSPVKGTVCHEDDDADHSATFEPLPFGLLNDPPTQTSLLSVSQKSVLTVPATLLILVVHDDELRE